MTKDIVLAAMILLCVELSAYPTISLSRRPLGVPADVFELVEETPIKDSKCQRIVTPASEYGVGDLRFRPDIHGYVSPCFEYSVVFAIDEEKLAANDPRPRLISLRSYSGDILWSGTAGLARGKPLAVSDAGVVLQFSWDMRYYEWITPDHKISARFPLSPGISRVFTFGTDGYWAIFEAPDPSPYEFLEHDDDNTYGSDFRYPVESHFPSQSGIIVFDPYGNRLSERELDAGSINTAYFSPSGQYMWILADKGRYILSMDRGIVFSRPGYAYQLIDFSPSEDVAMISRPDNMIVDLETGEIIAKITGIDEGGSGGFGLTDLEVGWVAVRGLRRDIVIVDYINGVPIARLPGSGSLMQFSGNGKYFAHILNAESRRVYRFKRK
ncbi:MAG: hypothetical protein K8R90_08890 [Candidatus Cloacimonetes bacterium]|nr:hypothetical protein [Candidatus Cloacimonadota bacterium]